MIKIKTKNDGTVSIRISKCKDQAQLIGEIGVTIKGLVQFAMLREKDNIRHAAATAVTFGKIFDKEMQNMLKYLDDAVKDSYKDDYNESLEDLSVGIDIDLNNIEEILKQWKEMKEGE